MTTINAQTIWLPDSFKQYEGQNIVIGFYAKNVWAFSDAMGALFDINAYSTAPEVIWTN